MDNDPSEPVQRIIPRSILRELWALRRPDWGYPGFFTCTWRLVFPSFTRSFTEVSVGQKSRSERWTVTIRLISSAIVRSNELNRTQCLQPGYTAWQPQVMSGFLVGGTLQI